MDFAQQVRDFFAGGGAGCNVTLPHKLAAFELADHVSSDAWRAGAVNTLAPLEDDTLFGDNTDGAGFLHDLKVNHGIPVEGCRVLLLGAGGAARGAIGPLLDEGPEQLVIANRHPGKAMLLAQLFAQTGPVSGSSLAGIRGAFDVIVNATSASVNNTVPDVAPDAFGSTSFAYDMYYADEPTAFVRFALDRGAARAVDGWGMLVEQAAESFFMWHGVRPDTAALLRHRLPQSSGPASR